MDFRSFLTESMGGRPATDHQLTIDMAKEVCMFQCGKLHRQFAAICRKSPQVADICCQTMPGFQLVHRFRLHK
ncbi:antA/AntB antirepressor family protein, partial [Ruminococcaceae bacterium OttesenSCG-928-L11]|nr:antA/AntB antirepressor family protein [Ruminococcaceae bacterium OttesenSCG-928-L11]